MTEAEFNRILESVAGERAEIAEPTVDSRYTERIDGTTPNGGDYSIAYYYDDNKMPCEKARAKSVQIVEYTKDGSRINEIYCILE